MPEASSISHAALATHGAAARVSLALRDMTANLMRITRGAGKPHDIVRQAQDLLAAIINYREVTAALPLPDELASMLSIERNQELPPEVSAAHADRLAAEALAIRGALQIAASRLMRQKAQEALGLREMDDGLRAVEEARKAPR